MATDSTTWVSQSLRLDMDYDDTCSADARLLPQTTLDRSGAGAEADDAADAGSQGCTSVTSAPDTHSGHARRHSG
ncbi:hypothetical protein KEM56_002203 [Ascosphaera pollenicola]|nr:hypothetical protein KEM56_002203 [Ascosphaera pollenicola]